MWIFFSHAKNILGFFLFSADFAPRIRESIIYLLRIIVFTRKTAIEEPFMTTTKTTVCLLLTASLALSACGDTRKERAESGALIGAGTGAVAGAIVAGNPATGALVGGAIGAGAGAAAGAISDHPWFHQ